MPKDFYMRRMDACREIDEMVKKGVDFQTISFKIETKYGFSDTFCRKRMQKLDFLRKKSEEIGKKGDESTNETK